MSLSFFLMFFNRHFSFLLFISFTYLLTRHWLFFFFLYTLPDLPHFTHIQKLFKKKQHGYSHVVYSHSYTYIVLLERTNRTEFLSLCILAFYDTTIYSGVVTLLLFGPYLVKPKTRQFPRHRVTQPLIINKLNTSSPWIPFVHLFIILDFVGNVYCVVLVVL